VILSEKQLNRRPAGKFKLPQGVKPALDAERNGTAEEVAEKVMVLFQQCTAGAKSPT
jgi:hypothetical protein